MNSKFCYYDKSYSKEFYRDSAKFQLHLKSQITRTSYHSSDPVFSTGKP